MSTGVNGGPGGGGGGGAAAGGGSSRALLPDGSPSQWTVHRNAAGRQYWHHIVEKRSVWDKPVELQSAREQAIARTPWKEYTSGDRKYYVHSDTKQSTWTLPPDLKAVLDSLPRESPAAASLPPKPPEQQQQHAPHFSIGASSPAPDTPGQAPATHIATAPGPGQAPSAQPQQHAGPPPGYGAAARPMYSGPPPGFGGAAAATAGGTGALPPHLTGPNAAPPGAPGARPVASPGPSVSAFASGEEAFQSLLRGKGVDASWTWESTMREIITDPLYKALKTMTERKAAFGRYIDSIKLAEENERKDKVSALEPAIRSVCERLKSENKLKMHHSAEAAGKLLDAYAEWRQLRSIGESYAKDLWNRLAREWKEAEATSTRELRHRNMDMLMSLLHTFEADVFTRWKDAHRTVLESDEWATDAHLSSMDLSDMVIVFDEHMKSLEKERGDADRARDVERAKEERHRRVAFRKRLQELVSDGRLTALTPWPAIYQIVKSDSGFPELMGQPGSSPLDLYFDVIDDLEQKLATSVKLVEELLQANAQPQQDGPAQQAVTVKPTTTLQEFRQKAHDALDATRTREPNGSASASPVALVLQNEDQLKSVFDELHARALRHLSDVRRRAERKLRHLTEDLRFALRKVDSASDAAIEAQIKLDTEEELSQSWDVWRQRLDKLALKDWTDMDKLLEASEGVIDADQVDEARKQAWERFAKRHREKLQEQQAQARDADGREEADGRRKAGDSPERRSPTSSRKRKSVEAGRTADQNGEADGAGPERRSSRRKAEDTSTSSGVRDRASRRAGADAVATQASTSTKQTEERIRHRGTSEADERERKRTRRGNATRDDESSSSEREEGEV
ncbi:hypothetical protein IE81DRAFT_248013 [Ceraceosorus guamensis]|uniref:WW domain-containing protein n=1 Tax=Ceraceosorus guamensis TaxID=1522189 RepID=A0A316VQS9_9BASI|nr:hypothetical protein IE81DRAFT_248013 [Ceraceosorus guamensis]PWN39967.1 hypothetical protein IE81DRAFT_248013 [Ceraceosorus guamensis]